MIETWSNGDSGKVVKEIIERNFTNLDSRITKLSEIHVVDFKTTDWDSNSGTIFIPYSKYLKTNPCIELYIKNGSRYSLVYNGYEIRDDGIELQSDLAYDGKVVIR